jgi:hypothetical protein
MTRGGRLGSSMLAAVLLAVAWSAVTGAQSSSSSSSTSSSSSPQAKKNPFLKLIEPWPAPEAMKQRRIVAEGLPLFSSNEPFTFTLITDFKALNKDRNPESRARYPGVLRIPGEGGADVSVPVQLSARGHARRNLRTCEYVPIRVEFPPTGLGKTVFARQDALKLIVQCVRGGDYEQYLLKEYLAYRLFNLVTHHSFRARLAKVTYIDRATGQTTGTRSAMFVEDVGDVAKRMEGRSVELPRLLFKDVYSDTLMPMMLFQYMIGNTDFSIHALHNVRLVQRPDKSLHPVPYDFDFSGLVRAPYAAPDRALMLQSVRDRLYRGPCRRPELVDPYVANFVAKKDLLLALPDAIPGLNKDSRDDTRSYLEGFYASIKSSRDVRKLFVECADKSTM